MSGYKAGHLYCSEMPSSKLWAHSLTLTYHIVIQRHTKQVLGIRSQRGLVALPARPAPGPSAWRESDRDTAVKSPVLLSCWAPPLGHLNVSSCSGRAVPEASQSYRR